tara:strand:- start:4435 stop:5760 length:1326 start_codon:yes stop_codon:yes gene_type:complete
VHLIPLDSIIVAPDRQRREFKLNELNELTDSIKSNGLFHPIVLRTEGERHILVAGERRLRAIADLHALGTPFLYDSTTIPLNEVPYVSLSDLSPLAAEEAELDENIRRTNLTWQERATAHARLNSLRVAQAAERGVPPPSVADIALEVRGSSEGINQETTRRELIVARHMANPSVKAAKSVDEAFKILRREEAAANHRALGAEVGRTFTADLHRALNGDSLEWMRECPDKQFDVILTDPPYGMGADEFGDSGGLAAGAHGYKDSEENFRKLFEVFSAESFRIAKEQAHLYMFCDIDYLSYIKDELRTDGWWVFRTPLIWYKPSGMRAPWPENGPQRKYETLVYAVKGKKPVLKMAPDVILCPPDANLGHAAQKPVALFEELLRRSVRPGDSVLDPFMGSGTIFPAAHTLKCKATGIELDQASYGIAVKRIEALRAQMELPL